MRVKVSLSKKDKPLLLVHMYVHYFIYNLKAQSLGYAHANRVGLAFSRELEWTNFNGIYLSKKMSFLE